MNAAERRGRILEYLRSSDGPLAAAALAQKLSVSRQIIVGDVALLRAGGRRSPPPPGATCWTGPGRGLSAPWPAPTAGRTWSGS